MTGATDNCWKGVTCMFEHVGWDSRTMKLDGTMTYENQTHGRLSMIRGFTLHFLHGEQGISASLEYYRANSNSGLVCYNHTLLEYASFRPQIMFRCLTRLLLSVNVHLLLSIPPLVITSSHAHTSMLLLYLPLEQSLLPLDNRLEELRNLR